MRYEADAAHAADRPGRRAARPDVQDRAAEHHQLRHRRVAQPVCRARSARTKYTFSQVTPVLGQARPPARGGGSRCAAGRSARECDLGRARRQDQDRLRPVPARGAQRGTRARSAHAHGQPGEPRPGALRERARAAAGCDPRPGRADRDAHRPGDARQREAAVAGEAQQPARASGRCARWRTPGAPGRCRRRRASTPRCWPNGCRPATRCSRSRMRASSRPSADAISPTATAIRTSTSACRRSRWAAGSTNGS